MQHYQQACRGVIEKYEGHVAQYLGDGREESPESKLDKLEALVVQRHSRPLSDVRFLSALLWIECEARYGSHSMTPQRFKEETLRALVELIEAAARAQPSVLLFEDAHWADPTTLELLDLLIDRVKAVPLHVLITHRPEVLPKSLIQLTDSSLAFRRGQIPEAVYTFKHALVQDAAYDSLLKSKRQALHGKIAEAISYLEKGLEVIAPPPALHTAR